MANNNIEEMNTQESNQTESPSATVALTGSLASVSPSRSQSQSPSQSQSRSQSQSNTRSSTNSNTISIDKGFQINAALDNQQRNHNITLNTEIENEGTEIKHEDIEIEDDDNHNNDDNTNNVLQSQNLVDQTTPRKKNMSPLIHNAQKTSMIYIYICMLFYLKIYKIFHFVFLFSILIYHLFGGILRK